VSLGLAVVEWDDANRVSCDNNITCVLVEETECKHAPYVFEEFRFTLLLQEVNERMTVRAAQLVVLRVHFLLVLDFSIDGKNIVAIDNGLFTTGNSHNCKSLVAHVNVFRLELPVIVRSPVSEHLRNIHKFMDIKES